MTKLAWLHQHHTATRNSGWGGLGKIFDLKHHGHGGFQLNDLTGVEAKFLVVIEHSVHVFDPNSVDRTIKDKPFSIRSQALSTVANLDG